MTTITPLPPPPSRDDPDNFAARGDEFLGALPTFVTQANAVAAEVEADAVICAAAADAATVALASSNFKGPWSSLTGPLAVPASVFHNNQFWMLLSNVADVTAKTPGVATEWQILRTVNALPNFTLTGSITAGQPIALNSDGTVSLPAAVAASTGSETALASGQYYPTCLYDTANAKIIIGGYNNAANGYKLQVGTINAAGTITLGGATAATTSAISMSAFGMVKDTTNNRIVAAWGGSSACVSCVGAVGDTITWGSPVTVSSGAGAEVRGRNHAMIFDALSGKVVLAYIDSSSAMQMILGTVNPATNAITWGSPIALSSYIGSNPVPAIAYLPHLSRYVITAGRYASLFSIDSGGTVTWGATQSTLMPANTDTNYPVVPVYCPDTQQVALVYRDTSTGGNVVMATATAGGLALEPITVNFAATATHITATYNAKRKRLQIAYAGGSGYATTQSGSVLRGYFLVDGSPIVVKSTASTYLSLAYDPNNGAAVVSSAGDNKAYTLFPYYSTATNYIGIAQESGTNAQVIKGATAQWVDENQSGLTTGARYYLTDAGALTTTVTDVFAGTAVSTTGLLVKG